MAPSQYLVFDYVYVLLWYMAITACLFNLMLFLLIDQFTFLSENCSSPLPMEYYLFLIMTYHLIALVEASSSSLLVWWYVGRDAVMAYSLVKWFIIL